MKFLRHLTAIVLVVAAIVGLGMLWAHASGGGTGTRQVPPRQVVLRAEQIRAGNIVHSDIGFQLTNSANLIRTCAIEAVLAAVVITVSAIRRRNRRRLPRT